MQVSAAAAVDAGSGNRFDEMQNRELGRFYLARLYRRYGSWSDAIAAYHRDTAIWTAGSGAGAFTADKFPAAVARYRTRVLVNSGLSAGQFGEAIYRPINARLARLGMLRVQAKRQLADRRRGGNRPRRSSCSTPSSCERPAAPRADPCRGAPNGAPPAKSSGLAVERRHRAADIDATLGRLLVDINFGFAHRVPHGLDPVIYFPPHDHFLDGAGTLLDYRLLVPLDDLELAVAESVGSVVVVAPVAGRRSTTTRLSCSRTCSSTGLSTV